MADSLLLVALASLAGASLALSPWPTAAAALAIAFALRQRTTRRTLGVALLALSVGGLRARAALGDAAARHEAATVLLRPPARCEGEARVVASPTVIRGGGASPLPAAPAKDGGPRPVEAQVSLGDGRIQVELEGGSCDGRPIPAPFRARLYGAPEDLRRGDRLFVVADLAPVHLFLNTELPDPRPGLAHSGVVASGALVEARLLSRGASLGALVDRARTHVRRRIEATYHPDAAALGRALVLGETDLDPLDDVAFRTSGLAHLLAVSGTHLVLAVVGFAAVLRALLLRVGPLAERVDVGRVSAALTVPAAWIYADFAGGGGSAYRAAAMLSAALLARALGRKPATVRVFGGSLLVFALVDPLIACDVSFGLSAGATAGLIVLQRPLAAALVRGPAPARKVLAAVATTLSAMLGCAPLLASMSPTLPVLGTASNLLAAPLGELAALPVCLLHGLLAWAPPVERGAALLGSGALLGVRLVARVTTATGAVVHVPAPTPLQLAALAVAAAGAWAAPDARRRLAAALAGAAAVLALEVGAIRAGAPRGLLRVSVLDVGQGDATVVDLPDGSAMLIDGGGFVGSPVDPGTRVVLPVLRARRRSRVAVAVLTHPHPDHFGGLVSALPELGVGELWDSGQGEDQGAGPAYASLLAALAARGVPIRRPRELCGPARLVGGASVEVLSPCPGFDPDQGANDNSLVLRLGYGRRAALLVGDAERHEEGLLLARAAGALHADLLKVGHHGSRTSSSPAFLAAVGPSLAVISSGVRNRFGHPHPLTLEALAAQRVPVARTDQGGELLWETDGESVRVGRPPVY